MLQHLCRKDRRIRTPRRLFFPTACLQEAGRRHVSRAHFHGICRMIMCACFLVFGDCFLVLIAFSNLVFRSLSPNAHRCVVRFRASFMSTVSSLLPVSPALDEIGTLRHLLKAYKSSASGIFCQILFHFPEQLHGPQNMRNLTNVYFGKRTFTYSFPGSAAGAEALKYI